MALSRCLKNHSWPQGRTTQYMGYVFPIGYPQTSLICGRCDEPGVIWLNDSEVKAYQSGERIFDGPNNFTRMKSDEKGVNTSK